MEDQFKNIIAIQSRIISLMFIIILILLGTLFLNECQRNYKTPPAATASLPAGDVVVGATESGNASLAKELTGFEGDLEKGKKLFKQNCAVCHNTTDQKLTGPGLKGVFNRVPKPAAGWMAKFIMNNEKVRREGDAYAKKVYEDNSKAQMTVFEGQLSEEEIKNIIFFVASKNN